MRFARIVAAGLVVFGFATPDVAFANGRFPRAQRLTEVNGDPDTLVLSATYGILLTTDGGESWRHLCELGFAFSIDDIDPLVEVVGDGAMVVQVSRSLNRAAEPFCDFVPTLGGGGSERVVDFALDREDPARLVALRLGRGESGGVENRLLVSEDSGVSFEPMGVALPPEALTFGLTFDAAPSDRERLYVSGADAEDRGVVLRSSDAGESFESAVLPLEPGEYPYIAGVHPTDPDVIYLRTDAWVADADGVLTANDALLYSDDGGQTFREVYRAGAKLFGFALSPDGSHLLIAYGDPVEPSRAVDAGAFGIYRAEVGEHEFSKIYAGPVSCLSWTQSSLYACTSQVERGFALGVAESAEFELDDAEPFAPLLDLTRVAGPIECPACSTSAVCAATWSETCALFGSCETSSASTEECVAGAPAQGDAGTGGATGDAGAGGAAGDTSMGGVGPGIVDARASGDGACGCRVAARTSNGGGAAWSILALVAMGWRLLRARTRLREMFLRTRTEI
jgi:hypothetical protein